MAVTIRDDEQCYPEFKEGQVLTHNDLNTLRDFLYSRFAFLGRAMLGFGVGCGLEGSVAGGTLTLTPGFALAQGGHELAIPTPQTFTIGSITLDTTSYPFIQGSPGGRTAILRATETIQATGGTCTPVGCTTHTELHCRGAEIVFVAGRLDLGAILARTVFTLKPIVPRTNPALSGFAALRDALYAELNGLVDNPTRTLLQQLKLEGPPGIDLLKVGIVNEVLYTLWDYWQCKQTETIPCGGVTGTPAVALGWLNQSGGNWIWDCRYRHHFQLSLALYRAMRGYRCEDLCDGYLDHIRVLLEDFTPPPIPSGPGSDPGGTVHVCTIKEIALGICGDWWGPPHEQFPPKGWIDPSKERQPPIWVDPGDPAPWETFDPFQAALDPWQAVTHTNELDPIQSGVVNSHSVLGTNAEKTKGVLSDSIREVGIEPSVTVLSADQFSTIEGLQPTLFAAASDSIYLGTNTAGAVIAMGTVPTARSLGQVSAIGETARSAQETANRAAGDAALAIKNGADVKASFEGIKGDFGKLQLTIDQFQKDWDVRGTRFDTFDKQLTATVDRVAAHEDTLKQLDARATQLGTRIDGVSVRFDALAVRQTTQVGTKTAAVNAAISEALNSMAKAVEAGSTKRAGPRVRQELATIQPQLGLLTRQSVAETSLVEAEPEALTTVVEGMQRAIMATGLSVDSPEFQDLSRSVESLKLSLGMGG